MVKVSSFSHNNLPKLESFLVENRLNAGSSIIIFPIHIISCSLASLGFIEELLIKHIHQMNMTHSQFLTVSKGPIELQMFFRVVKCLWDLDVLHLSERQQGDEIIVAVPGISNILYIHKESFSQLSCKRCKTVSWYFGSLSPEDNTGLINTFLIFGLAVRKLFEEHCK